MPTRAYVTFENEFTQTVMREIKTAPVFNVQAEFETAHEPSDINWENRQSSTAKWKRIFLMIIYLLILLMFNFGIQVYSKYTVANYEGKYESD